jgi:nicotinamidase-related amidase
MNTAILIIDMLNDFFINERLSNLRESLCFKINELTDWGRTHQFPIIWVRQEFKADLEDAFLIMKKKQISITIENTAGAQILAELNKESGDIELIKKRYSAFYKTNLEEFIKKNSITQLILCGINTHACVRMAAIDAYQRDMDVIIAVDCVNSYDHEHHEISLRYLDNNIASLLSNEQIIAFR